MPGNTSCERVTLSTAAIFSYSPILFILSHF
jgi:hypothetical protein